MSDSMPEEWRPVVGYEGSYEVSNHGRVRSVKRVVKRTDGRLVNYEGHVLKPHVDDCGYPEVILSRSSRGWTVGIHKLVCRAFNGEKPEWAHNVRHLNGNPADNRPENLAWGTRSQNMQDKMTHGTNHWANQTHCKWGHEFTPENTRLERNGRKRCCRACKRESLRRRYAAKKRSA